MFKLYRHVAIQAFRRLVKGWYLAFSLPLYGVIFFLAAAVTGRLGMVGGLLLGFVIAACFSSYLEIVAHAVDGSRLKLTDLKRTFGARLWDVVSVMFAVWILSLGVEVIAGGVGPAKAPAISAMFGLVVAFFFNAVPELLYQGTSRSFALLMESGRFVMEHVGTWFLPNLVFAAALVYPSGAWRVERPGELLLLFNSIFSASGSAVQLLAFPLWSWPLVLVGFHYAMIFRGLLYHELASGNSRMRAFRSQLGR